MQKKPPNQSVTPVKIVTQKQISNRAIIRLGEILKKRNHDKFPHLEVTVEIENDVIDPKRQFIYLFSNDYETQNQIQKEQIYPIERLEMAQNIGKCYLRLDFDRTKKYKLLFVQYITSEKSSSASRAQSPVTDYEIISQSLQFSIQASVAKAMSPDSTYRKEKQEQQSQVNANFGNTDDFEDIRSPVQDERQQYYFKSPITNNILSNKEIKNQKLDGRSPYLVEDEDPYQVQDSNREPNESGDSIIQSPFTTNRYNMVQTAILAQYNPTTRTYFKCSIYSPSNRLYTVDEVNSNYSADQFNNQSSAKHTGKNRQLMSYKLRGSMTSSFKQPSRLQSSWIQSNKSERLSQSSSRCSHTHDEDDQYEPEDVQCELVEESPLNKPNQDQLQTSQHIDVVNPFTIKVNHQKSQSNVEVKSSKRSLATNRSSAPLHYDSKASAQFITTTASSSRASIHCLTASNSSYLNKENNKAKSFTKSSTSSIPVTTTVTNKSSPSQTKRQSHHKVATAVSKRLDVQLSQSLSSNTNNTSSALRAVLTKKRIKK